MKAHRTIKVGRRVGPKVYGVRKQDAGQPELHGRYDADWDCFDATETMTELSAERRNRQLRLLKDRRRWVKTTAETQAARGSATYARYETHAL